MLNEKEIKSCYIMKFEELIRNYDVKLVALKNKRRFTTKAQGYAHIDRDGIIMIPRKWRVFQEKIEAFGVLNQYISDLGYYLCCLDIDTKDFPITKLLSKYPSSIVETKHGFHVYYLSTDPIRLKQLTGKEKELCPVDLRGQRDPSQCKEGSYTKMYGKSSGNLNIVNFNEVVSFVYSLYNIEARPTGEYADNVKQGSIIKQNNTPKSNIEIFLSYYLFYQKDDWESAYPTAFPWGLRLAGWLDKKSMQRIAFKLMRLSEYYGPRKWILAFLSGYETGTKGRPHFGDEDLKPIFKTVFKERFEQLDEKEIEKLARYCKNVRLYEIFDILGDVNL